MTHERILVVDDDHAVVRLMRAYLQSAEYEVLVAYNGKTALHTIRRERPDLVLLDLMLPDLDGWEITRTVRSDPYLATLPIIMVTARVTDVDKILGLELGADDYVTKPYNPREVVARVRARLRIQRDMQHLTHPLRLHVGELIMDVDLRRVMLAGNEIELTATEFDLLRVLLQHPGYVWTRGELIRTALGSDFDGIDRTVDSHIRNLRRKIEPDLKRPTYIQTVYGVGYRLGAPV
ncbi:MAG: response regulator transcription factor [Anaerolineae bacterium]|nr:response regulator transcription factor [Anaerolineae bacterium]MCO5192021.1 response regulator transcription factor [Anaerolineae bacterium]MCO5199416.1 response regulator transcription factor [Anaerolineae bacterium]MCO5206049.1 response regulator transcription factor [Anaerolineae bacterium]